MVLWTYSYEMYDFKNFWQADEATIEELDDDSLSMYIPIYEDRIAARCFCKENGNKSKPHDTRQTLLEKLRQKMWINNRTAGASSEDILRKNRRHMGNNKMAEKKTRKIEIGWFHEGKQPGSAQVKELEQLISLKMQRNQTF